MKTKIQLITYVDRLGAGNIGELRLLFQNELKGLFGGVHILPFFFPINGEDAGFDPIDHLTVDPSLGDWDDIRQLSQHIEIMSDMIVNHVSSKSKPFKDYLQKGEDSEYASLFLNFEKVFPKGATQEELLKIYRPRPGFPFTTFKFDDGTEKLIWTTFTSNQIDIDVKSSQGEKYLNDILGTFQQAGIKMIRLDAAGYAVKLKGSSCFMIDETFDFISSLTSKARKLGIEVLVEIHSYYKTQIEIAKKVDYVYDFALPVLVLDTLFNRNADNLKNWLEISPRNAFTVLDTHDGIGIVDVASEKDNPGLIDDKTLNIIVEQIHQNSNKQSLKATGAAASNLDLYQVNCTYYDALGRNDNAYLIARAIQFFVPGIPQVYYVGLLAGENDMELLSKTNIGRDINRHYYTKEELTAHLQKPVVQKLRQIMMLRNNHQAFNGEFTLMKTTSDNLTIKWNKDKEWVLLSIDLKKMKMDIEFSLFRGESNITFNN